MSRRTSRALIAVLTLTVVWAIVAYLHQGHATAIKQADAANGKNVTTLMVVGGPAGTEKPAAPATVPAARSGDFSNLLADATVMRSATPTSAPAEAGRTPAAGGDESWDSLLHGNAAAGAAQTPAPRPTLATPAAVALSGNPLVDGKARIEAGELLAGRKILDDALNAGNLSAADTASAMALITTANKTLIFEPNHYADDPYGGNYLVKAGDNMARIAAAHAVTADFLCRINALSDARKLRAASTIKIVQGPFHAVVTKSKFTMDLYLGGLPGDHSAMYVTTFPVGLGKDDSTPSGTWMVEPQRKLSNPTYYSPRGEGVIPAGDPKNPLGHFWIGLIGTDGGAVGKTSYGIHGTIDPSSIGKQASLGCIRMKNEDVTIVYEMLVEGKSNVLVKD